MNRSELTSRDWFGKAAAAVLLGFTLTMALTSTLGLLLSDGGTLSGAGAQLTLWLVSPIWCLILGLSFLFCSTARAWSLLAAANLGAWLLYAAARVAVV